MPIWLVVLAESPGWRCREANDLRDYLTEGAKGPGRVGVGPPRSTLSLEQRAGSRILCRKASWFEIPMRPLSFPFIFFGNSVNLSLGQLLVRRNCFSQLAAIGQNGYLGIR